MGGIGLGTGSVSLTGGRRTMEQELGRDGLTSVSSWFQQGGGRYQCGSVHFWRSSSMVLVLEREGRKQATRKKPKKKRQQRRRYLGIQSCYTSKEYSVTPVQPPLCLLFNMTNPFAWDSGTLGFALIHHRWHLTDP